MKALRIIAISVLILFVLAVAFNKAAEVPEEELRKVGLVAAEIVALIVTVFVGYAVGVESGVDWGVATWLTLFVGCLVAGAGWYYFDSLQAIIIGFVLGAVAVVVIGGFLVSKANAK